MLTKPTSAPPRRRTSKPSPARVASSNAASSLPDATRERLLVVARELFATQGVDAVTVRHLAESAGVNVAAVNYHFGSKDGLLLVLFRREARVIVEQRLQRLEEVRACDGPLAERLELFARALLEPALRWCLQAQMRSLYVPMLQRAATRGAVAYRAIMDRENSDLQPFAAELGAMLPTLPAEEIFWRLHYLLGLEHSFVGDLERLRLLSNGVCDTQDVDRMIERTIAFATQGLGFGMPGESTSFPGRKGRGATR